MAERTVFAGRTVFWLILVGGISFLGAMGLALFGNSTARSSGADSFSVSAVGHRAFVDLLGRLDVPVQVSRNATATKTSSSTLLIIAEPRLNHSSSGHLKRLLRAPNALLVLPKWDWSVDLVRPAWIDESEMISPDTVARIAGLVARDVRILRPTGSIDWRGAGFATPTLARPQLVAGRGLTPIIAAGDGMLVGEVDWNGQRVWVVSDPDILSNHGLGQGDNALLAVQIVESLRPDGGAVIVDETVHGFEIDTKLNALALEPPVVVTAIVATAALAILLWSATVRFGAPLPPPPAIRPGKAGLLDNTAGLLEYGGHGAVILQRYLRVMLRNVARRLHAPAQLLDAELTAWLDRVGRTRRVGVASADLGQEVAAIGTARTPDGARLIRVARSINRWKQEMLHGPGGNPVDHPRP
ncbi:MAG: DUF4350 domain-containing protein [Inquilinus sp.]|nr:DUF4350 domain-containing protein [Inquilinus sp.]